MRRLIQPLRLSIIFFLLAAAGIPAHAQAPDYEYFDETGHNVQGEFLRFYQGQENPLLLYGYPITEEFTNADGLRVQYFQRARFEFHTEPIGETNVQLTPLGARLYAPSNPLDTYSPLACKYYAETGHSVCYEFLEFFEANGGVEQLGLPVSSFEYRQETIVQYFENARLEWHPWRQPGQRVVIADLGRIYFDKAGEDPGLLSPTQPLNAITQPVVLSIGLRAFVKKAVTLSSDEQTIYIISRDQRGQALPQVDCTTRLQWTGGETEAALSQTGRNGLAMLTFSFSSLPEGQLVSAEVSCTYGKLQTSTRTSFRVWY